MVSREDKQKTELFKAFREKDTRIEKYLDWQAHLNIMHALYQFDDIFRREVDGLRKKTEKKKMDIEQINKKIDEFVREAEYRAYIASFDNMKKNYEARKKEMSKIKEAFSGKAN